MSQEKMVAVERGILDKNDRFARANRRWLAERGVLALNFVSSPGSGKTSLLVETIRRLQGELPLAVIEGDQQTSNDAERIRATGARAIQINTGKGCHLDASMVEHALAHLAPADDSVLFIENVGNLVCPAAFDLGEAAKVVVLSVTEGEDKPLKYPDMFAAAQLMLLNKVDLLPYLDFDVAQAIDCARRVNPAIEVLQVSATRGQGMDGWLDWVRAAAGRARAERAARRAEAARKLALLEELIASLRGACDARASGCNDARPRERGRVGERARGPRRAPARPAARPCTRRGSAGARDDLGAARSGIRLWGGPAGS
jgi:hydrogenase nickel incorporation protein HypB